jgi:hypothetical protein
MTQQDHIRLPASLQSLADKTKPVILVTAKYFCREIFIAVGICLRVMQAQ